MEKYWIHGKILSLDLNRVFEILCFKKSLKFKITIEIWNIGCYCMDCGCYCIVVILKSIYCNLSIYPNILKLLCSKLNFNLLLLIK